jgi:hypothetical protein
MTNFWVKRIKILSAFGEKNFLYLFKNNIIYNSMIFAATKIGIRDPRSEIRDPRSGIRDPRSGIRDPRSGMDKKSGCGINTPVPQLWFKYVQNLSLIKGNYWKRPTLFLASTPTNGIIADPKGLDPKH